MRMNLCHMLQDKRENLMQTKWEMENGKTENGKGTTTIEIYA